MKTKIILLIALLAIVGFGSLNVSQAAEPLSADDAYKAVVKIKTYGIDWDYDFALNSTGSGVIFSQDGLVLTNHHVVTIEEEADDTEWESAYQICLPQSINQEPDCSFTAQLIAKNKDLDMAILKIQPIPGLSNQTVFPHLNLNFSGDTQLNYPVTVIGYPGTGGENITVSAGVVSGWETRHNLKWVKTDAAVSYGNSGGAFINSDGEVIAITSAMRKDTLGSFGYAINLVSVKTWFNQKKGGSVQQNSLQNELENFSKKQKNLKNTDIFTNSDPKFSIRRPDGWRFTYPGEDYLVIDEKDSNEGGSVAITITSYPRTVTVDDLIPLLSRSQYIYDVLSTSNITVNEDVTVNGHQGKKLYILSDGVTDKGYIFPVRNYVVYLDYDYGHNDKDKHNVDEIIQSFEITDSTTFSGGLHQYQHDNPLFSITTDSNWPLKDYHSKEDLVVMLNKEIPEASVDIQLHDTDDVTFSMSSDEFLKAYKYTLEHFREEHALRDLRVDLLNSNAHYEINGSLPKAIMLEYIDWRISNGVKLVHTVAYYIKTQSKYIVVSLNIYSTDAQVVNRAKSEFNKMIQALSLVKLDSPAPASQTTASNNTSNDANTTLSDNDPLRFRSHNHDSSLVNRVKGKLLLAVEDRGRIFYIDLGTGKKWEVTFANALNLFESLALGISDTDLGKVPLHTQGTVTATGNRLKGKLLLQVEDRGRIWYVDFNGRRWEITWQNLMDLFESLSLGITNSDLTKIPDPS